MDLPPLDSDYALTREQIEQCRTEGHLYLSGVLSSEEIAAYRPVIARAVDKAAEARGIVPGQEGYRRYFVQVANLWRQDEQARAFVFARRLAKLAAELMGVSAVRLYHDQALFKEPGGKPTPWHQDQHYWPLDTDNTLTLWMPLVDVNASMGSMNFACGSQKEGYIGDLPISTETHDFFEQFLQEKQYPIKRYDLRAGDATFHSGLILHSAEGNQSEQMREVMTIIYYPDGTRLMEPDNRNREQDLVAFHPGQKPGEVAASELNPLLYDSLGVLNGGG